MTHNDFCDAYKEIELRAYGIANGIRQNGHSTLINHVDEEKVKQNHPFDLGLHLVCAGKDMIVVNRAMNEFIEQEIDPRQKTLKQCIREAVLGLQAGISPGLLVRRINSYVDFGKENALHLYEKEMDYEKHPEALIRDLEVIEELEEADPAGDITFDLDR